MAQMTPNGTSVTVDDEPLAGRLPVGERANGDVLVARNASNGGPVIGLRKAVAGVSAAADRIAEARDAAQVIEKIDRGNRDVTVTHVRYTVPRQSERAGLALAGAASGDGCSRGAWLFGKYLPPLKSQRPPVRGMNRKRWGVGIVHAKRVPISRSP